MAVSYKMNNFGKKLIGNKKGGIFIPPFLKYSSNRN